MADTLGAVLSALQLNFPANFGLDQMAALVVALCALMISGFVSGSEIAFFSLTPQQCDELDETPRGQNVLAMIGKPERLLATILIANNLVNVTIVILCNYALGPVFQGMAAWMSFLLQTVILTFLILLFGEILPKLIANSDNMRWIRFALGGVKLMMAVFSPISSLLVRGSTIVNRVVVKKESDVTAEELSQALDPFLC